MRKKVLVCITPQSNSKRLIDKGVGVSLDITGELHILHVEKGNNLIKNDSSINLLHNLFLYAAQHGGIVHGLCGDDIYDTIKQFMKKEMITNIIVGAPGTNIKNISNTIVDKLQQDFPYVHIHILEREIV